MGRTSRAFLTAFCVVASLSLDARGMDCVQDLGIDGANSVSADGALVVGATPASSWRWTSTEGITDLGGVGGNARVSRTGSVVVADDLDADGTTHVASVREDGGGWRQLGGLPGDAGCGASLSSSYGVNGNGSRVVGRGWLSCSSRAFEWTKATGMQEPQPGCPRGPGASGRCRANNVSDDGRVIVGWEEDSLTSERRCARWVDGTGSVLEDIGRCGEAWAVNNDGSIIAGEGAGLTGGSAYRWKEATGIELLGSLPSPQQTWGMSDDGRVLVGSYGGGDITLRTAWIWTEGGVMETLSDHLNGAGCTDLAGWVFYSATDASADGTVIVGRGTFNGTPTSFAATIPSQSAGAVGEATGVIVSKSGGADLDLSWNQSCGGEETDYGIYAGTIGDYKSHESIMCTTGGGTATSFTPQGGDRYYLVVPHDGTEEGASGETSWAGERAQGGNPCFPRSIKSTCP